MGIEKFHDAIDTMACSAVLSSGQRCKNNVEFKLSFDINAKIKTLVQSLPTSLKRFITNKYGVDAFDRIPRVNCCYFCTRHHALYSVLKVVTLSSSAIYFAAYPETLLEVFFEDVHVTKLGDLVAYKAQVGKLRPAVEITKRLSQTMTSTTSGSFSIEYIALLAFLYSYDHLKPKLARMVGESTVVRMLERTLDVLFSDKKNRNRIK